MPVTATVEQRPGSVGWPLLIVLASLAAVAPVSTDLYLPGFPAMGQELGASASAVQLTLTTFLVGLAAGQLVMGPLSDRYGRRPPLLVSTAVCVVAGVVCAVAPNIAVLAMARLVQGLSGAGGMVIGRAVIADLVTGRAAARAFTLMVTVGGVAPVLAPTIGGLLSGPVGWRGMLWTVAALCVAMFVGVLLVLRETHPRESRTAHASYAAALRRVAGTAGYWAPVATLALSFSVMMAYISASPFVYQNVVGLSAVGYGIAFGVNACGLVATGWVVCATMNGLVTPWAITELRHSLAMSAWQLAHVCEFGNCAASPPAIALPAPNTSRMWTATSPTKIAASGMCRSFHRCSHFAVVALAFLALLEALAVVGERGDLDPGGAFVVGELRGLRVERRRAARRAAAPAPATGTSATCPPRSCRSGCWSPRAGRSCRRSPGCGGRGRRWGAPAGTRSATGSRRAPGWRTRSARACPWRGST